MKAIARLLIQWFDLRDKEVILREFRTRWWFLSAWIVRPEYGHGWRLRLSAVELLRQIVFSRCTRCGSAFRIKELINDRDRLSYFPSGSICHDDCEPSDHFKDVCRKMTLSYRPEARS